MAGLRDLQKEKRREAIMAAAANLFKIKGFDAASMEEIASLAELSVGTVYNYFKTKGDICLAIYRADRDLVLKATDKVIDAVKSGPPKDAITAICKLMETDFETEVAFIDRGAWESLFAAAFTAQPSLAAALVGDEFMRVGQFERLLAALQAKGAVGRGADIKSAAEFLGALNLWYFVNWVVGLRTGTVAEGGRLLDGTARKTLRRQVKQLVDGLKA